MAPIEPGDVPAAKVPLAGRVSRLLAIALVASGLSGRAMAQAGPDAKEKLKIRVGIVVYQDLRGYDDYVRKTFPDLQKSSLVDGGVEVAFELNRGRYDEILDWFKNGRIDVAIAPAGVFDAIRSTPGAFDADEPGIDSSQAGLFYRYLGTKASSGQGGDPKDPVVTYKAQCYVNKASKITDYQGLKDRALLGNLEFLLVEPLSISGDLMCRLVKKEMGVDDKQDRNESTYTYSHTNSLRILMDHHGHDTKSGRDAVAFVYAAAIQELGVNERRKAESELIPLDVATLQGQPLPETALCVRVGAEGSPQSRIATRLRELMYNTDSVPQSGHGFVLLPRERWKAIYDEIRGIKKRVDPSGAYANGNRLRLDDIKGLLRRYRDTHDGKAPRLALVLDGGGAKCSYQVGATRAIERMLDEINAGSKKEEEIDLSPIVGTSGGAINALPIALGATRILKNKDGSDDSTKYDNFRAMWTELDQRKILRPSKSLEILNGLFVASVLFWALTLAGSSLSMLLGLIGLRDRSTPPGRMDRRVVKPLLLIFAALGLAAICTSTADPIISLERFPDHRLQHAWTFVTSGNLWMGLSLLVAAGVLGCLEKYSPFRFHLHWAVPNFSLVVFLLIACVGWLVFCEKSLFSRANIEDQLGRNFKRLIGDDKSIEAMELDEVSNHILSHKLLTRDLVITGSSLEADGNDIHELIPDDLYFYYDHNANRVTPPNFGRRGILMEVGPPGHPNPIKDSLLTIIAGSGAIYPLFPSRRIEKAIRGPDGKYVPKIDLIDGGFAHNSPIEAAVEWGATHIIVIEATPEIVLARDNNLVQKFVASFNHLYHQAQLIDARSRERVAVFTLTPQDTAGYPDLIDFTGNIIERTIDQGEREAGDKGHANYRLSTGLPTHPDVIP